jgi:hypothetical protein
MGPVEIAGGILGAALAAFATTWAAFARPLKKQIDAVAEARPQLPSPEVTSKDLDELKGEVRRGFDELKSRIQAMENRQNTMVTSEEFASYTGHTTQAINQLTEKVGRVTGALETWARGR